MNNTSGTHNVATGVLALNSNTTGSHNTANGYAALQDNLIGNNNTAIGDSALFSNAADGNTAIGYQALLNSTSGTFNTGIGTAALKANMSGGGNVAIGQNALLSNVTGDSNMALGFNALSGNTAGTNNITLGTFAGDNLTGSQNIDIGNEGVAGESFTIRIGTPAFVDKTFIASIRGVTTGNNNAVPVLIDSAGQLGTTSSSRRFKKEIKPMDKASEAILALKPVTFHYKSDNANTPQFGLLAEDVAEVNPDLVVRDENGEIYTVRYDAVNAMLLNEFLKEHKAFLEEQSKVHKLEAALGAVNARLKEQEEKIEKVSHQIEVTTATPKMVSNQ
jgi:endosialidase-like protein